MSSSRNPSALCGCLFFVCAALAGCDRPVDVTAKPTEITDSQTTESAPASVYVAQTVDLSRTEDELARLLPADIANIARRVRGAACTTSNAKQVCLDVRLSGRISRDGQASIAGSEHGLELRVPLRYELVAQPVGQGAATPISGHLALTARFTMALDDHWQPVVKLDPGFTWQDGPKIKILDGETSVQADVEPVLAQRLGRLQPAAFAGLVPADLRQQVELAWRYLHYPIALSQDQQIWLRGTPLGLHFGGIKVATGLQELRMVITARLQTFIGDRPAPLPPYPLPALGSGLEAAGGGITLPADITYAALSADAAARLPAVPSRPAADADGAGKTDVKALDFFAAGKRLGVAVHLGMPANGSWFRGHGVAYYLATPDVRPGSSQIVLTDSELYASGAKALARTKDLAFLSDARFADAINQSVSLDLSDKLAAAAEIMKHETSLPLAKGLRLWLQPGEPKVVKLTPGIDGLRLQIETGGQFVVRREGTDVASDAEAASKATP